MDGRCIKIRVTSRRENDLARSLIFYFQVYPIESKQESSFDKPKISAARHKRNIHDVPPDEVEEFDAIVQNVRKKLTIQWKRDFEH